MAFHRKQRIQRITRTLTRSDALILKSPDPPTNPDVFQETLNPFPRPSKSPGGSTVLTTQSPPRSPINPLPRPPKPVGGSSVLTTQSPPRSPSPNPRSSSPKKQSKAIAHPGMIPLASHLITARRIPRHLNKSLTLTGQGVPSSSSSSVRSSSSGRFNLLKMTLAYKLHKKIVSRSNMN